MEKMLQILSNFGGLSDKSSKKIVVVESNVILTQDC